MSYRGSSIDGETQGSHSHELNRQPGPPNPRTISAPYTLAGPRASTRCERQQTGSRKGTSVVSRASREHNNDARHGEEYTKKPIWGFAAPLPRVKRPRMESRRTRAGYHGGDRQPSPTSHTRAEFQRKPTNELSIQPSAPSGTEPAPQVGVTPDRNEEAHERRGRPSAEKQQNHHQQQPPDLLRRATTARASTYHPDERDLASVSQQASESVRSRPSRQTQDLADEHISAQDQVTPFNSAAVRSTASSTHRQRRYQDLDYLRRTKSRQSEAAEVEAARRRLQGLADTAEHESGLSYPHNPNNINWEEDFAPEDDDGSADSYSQTDESDGEPPYYNFWGRCRAPLRQPFAEFLGTLVFMTIGLCGSIVRMTAPDDYGNLLSAYLAWGLGVMIGIYVAGGVSGGHLNPALSLMLSVFRGFPWRLCWQYVVAQILGALTASGIVYGLYRDAIEKYSLSSDVTQVGPAFWTAPRQDLSKPAAFFTEFTATAIASGSVLALGDESNSPPGAGMHAFIIGLLVSSLCMAFSYNTGTALNPARDLGPRLVTWMAGFSTEVFTLFDWWWIWGPWVGTITGALFGAFVYDLLIFQGGESPVNYPTSYRLRDAIDSWKDTRTVSRIGRGKDIQGQIDQKLEAVV
ncbi:hypothetical protein PV08_02317 [Exophiala spinifera]|uniref:Aquaporin n=1 Tax=Exophiala spinifera TaxID=91928 RepID=A0A0D2BHG5_9EURO|nr:uncharacterized protein PV08_02317 [Exophiala spinifera]KIW18030.1 hypothetical protein PV08_02317 [Exophiala spinifera]